LAISSTDAAVGHDAHERVPQFPGHPVLPEPSRLGDLAELAPDVVLIQHRPDSGRLEVLSLEFDRVLIGWDEDRFPKLHDLLYQVFAGPWLSEQRAVLLHRIDQQKDRYLAPRVAGCFLIITLPSRRPVAGYYLKREQAFLRGKLPGVAVDEVLWPAREIWHVLGLIVFDEEGRVLEEVIDVVPRERPAYSEDDLRVPACWCGGVHDDFPFNYFSADVIGQQFDDVMRSTHGT
jgi:hypothetical protein